MGPSVRQERFRSIAERMESVLTCDGKVSFERYAKYFTLGSMLSEIYYVTVNDGTATDEIRN